ncbi:hypothetical protein ILYODFUR_014512, partial [Ilyodon furcidens]
MMAEPLIFLLIGSLLQDNFPSPTLSPSTLNVMEGGLVSLTCSAPAPCLPHPPNLTWTPTLGDTQETLQVNQDKTLIKTSVLNFTASHLHHGQNISCTAVYKKQDESSDASLTNGLMPNVSFPLQILLSSKCSETSDWVNCSCETVGNPSPETHWYLNGKTVNQSSRVAVINEYLNRSHLRSIITVKEPQGTDLSTLLCFSFNSVGSVNKCFCVSCLDNSTEIQGQIPMPVFIASVVAFLLIVCALLFVVGFQKIHYKPTRITSDTGTVATGQHLTKDKNGVDNPQPSTGTDLRCTNLPSSSNSEEMSKNSGEKSENVVYAKLKFTEKNKMKTKEDYANMNPSFSSSLEEEEE